MIARMQSCGLGRRKYEDQFFDLGGWMDSAVV